MGVWVGSGWEWMWLVGAEGDVGGLGGGEAEDVALVGLDSVGVEVLDVSVDEGDVGAVAVADGDARVEEVRLDVGGDGVDVEGLLGGGVLGGGGEIGGDGFAVGDVGESVAVLDLPFFGGVGLSAVGGAGDGGGGAVG